MADIGYDMPCYHPLDSYQIGVRPNGKKLLKILGNSRKLKIVDGKPKFVTYRQLVPQGQETILLPCGQCIGCRLERSRQKAMRAVHEAQMHEDNCFITLTYDDEHLGNGSLNKEDFKNFMKRLREYYVPKCPYPPNTPEREEWLFKHGIRYMHCAEYGEALGRPHHHACLFNFDFPDKKYWRKTKDGHAVYVSETLSKLWKNGIHEIGTLTFESAAYVARYITKKVNGAMADDHYGDLLPEFCTQSLKPGIGFSWYEKYKDTDVHAQDQVWMRGMHMKPPKYYMDKYELTNPEEYAKVKEERKKQAKESPDNSRSRLAVREKIKLQQVTQLQRSLK